jgi:predicted secreted Zn-dependent protease
MVRIKFYFLLIMAFATTSFAGADVVSVASIDSEGSSQPDPRLIPPRVNETCEYYEVKGNNEKELRRQLAQNGCTGDDGKKYDSLTRWHVTWDYGYKRGLQSCSAEAFMSNIDIVIRYPKWIRTADVFQPLADRWDVYLNNLTTHEQGHRNMVIEAATELARDVAALPPAPSCAVLDQQVRAVCKNRIDKLNTDTEAYDAATGHGAKQGAVFP